jgi:bifunctional non-homologous end joining protein LigD
MTAALKTPGKARELTGSGTSRAQEVAGVRLTHPDRVLYPEQGLTKRDLAEFYDRIKEWILPHIVERPLSLLRCPEGRGKECFFQKHAGTGVPEHLKPVMIAEEKARREYLFVEDERGLVSLAQMGVLEIHPWGSRVSRLEEPDRLTLDLDPGPGVGWPRVLETARRIRDLLDKLGLASFVKTTGGKGLHVVVPLAPRQTWAMLKEFSRVIALEMVRRFPREYTATLSKADRNGKIFIDYLRNSRGATAVAAYSTRARAGAPVSTPVAWSELGPGLRSDRYTIENLPRRLDTLKKDPWDGFFKLRQGISKALLKKLEA